ncbi:wax ester/triacylglycerol synthase family O-acyltransferase [Kibdelosporangium philippinense]|uniref:Diacylglycerol O-acyltransferase n=1 Tax=Kibdelosporangium philippinense TaxID=211113 RepID=A0ABS8ZE39_9PSEU|nr:wax ester/triacylglycerol synthase family O-acyltransferase [Kibdelosporangium philippinense]MCE7006089.1 wax ester/triacylglycerol synthase family O-acyltransferase [Kibdelosporangium philippinense]
MPDRLSAVDASFIYLEDQATPMHVGGVAVFRRPRGGFDYDELVRIIGQRLDLIPRYRQRVVSVPGHLARPVWVDDPDFDLTYHVRRSALPRPGSDDQLHDLVARLMSRPLDPARPLWETYLVEGLAKGRFAIITKTHLALVDGIGTIDIGQLILDTSPAVGHNSDGAWIPRRAPTSTKLLIDALKDAVQSPRELVENARAVAGDLVASLADTAGGLVTAISTASTAPSGPLNVRISPQRRFAVARTSLEDFRAIRNEHNCTVNDAVLATLAGALRTWLLSRGQTVTSSTTLRALVPLAVREDESDETVPGMLGNTVTAKLVDLPVGEPNAVVRLHHVSHAMRVHNDSASKVAAGALRRMSGFAPPTLHSLGARAAGSFSRKIFNVVITNVPGPQESLYAGNAKMMEMFPVVPLVRNQALAIGVTSYDGGVYFGLNGDRGAMSDVDNLARMVEESLEELLSTVRV